MIIEKGYFSNKMFEIYNLFNNNVLIFFAKQTIRQFTGIRRNKTHSIGILLKMYQYISILTHKSNLTCLLYIFERLLRTS